MGLRERVGRLGVWSRELRTEEPALHGGIHAAAAELESLGYGAVWLGSSPAVGHAAPLLAATSRLVVATGILNIWQHPPGEVAGQTAALAVGHPGRFVLGLGVSHEVLVEGYRKPYSRMVEYLDALDCAPVPVPSSGRVLAALGPRMLRLAASRSAGAHPYMVPVEHIAVARELLGAGPLLAPEINVVLESDPSAAREAARDHLSGYLGMANYTDNLRRFGFDDADLTEGGSDRLVDALYIWGNLDQIRERALECYAAGADHLALQVIRARPAATPPMVEYRLLADALRG